MCGLSLLNVFAECLINFLRDAILHFVGCAAVPLSSSSVFVLWLRISEALDSHRVLRARCRETGGPRKLCVSGSCCRVGSATRRRSERAERDEPNRLNSERAPSPRTWTGRSLHVLVLLTKGARVNKEEEGRTRQLKSHHACTHRFSKIFCQTTAKEQTQSTTCGTAKST